MINIPDWLIFIFYLIIFIGMIVLGFYVMFFIGCPMPELENNTMTGFISYSCWYPTLGLVLIAAGVMGLIFLFIPYKPDDNND